MREGADKKEEEETLDDGTEMGEIGTCFVYFGEINKFFFIEFR